MKCRLILLVISFLLSSCTAQHPIQNSGESNDPNAILQTPNKPGSPDSLYILKDVPVKIVRINEQDTISMTTDTTNSVRDNRYSSESQELLDPTNSSLDSNCYHASVEVKAESSSFMTADYASQAQFILPGLIFKYEDFENGNYRPLSYERNPITLSTDNPNMTGASFQHVVKPNLVTLREGLTLLYKRFDDSHTGTMNLRYRTYESNSFSQMTLRIFGKVDIKGLASGGFSNEYFNKKTSQSHVVTVDVIKPLYTVNAVKSFPQNGYFTEGLTGVKNPVIVSSVTYGIRILANIDIKTTSQEQWDKFKSNYKSPFADAQLDFDYITADSSLEKTVNCYVVGGPGNSTLTLKKTDFEQEISRLVAEVKYATARPISYTLSDLAGNLIKTTSATDVINTQYCVKNDNPKLSKVIIQFQSGGSGKDGDSRLNVNLVRYEGPIANFDNLEDVRRDVNYPGNNNVQRDMTITARTELKYKDLANSGGKIMINFLPRGNDTWELSTLKVMFIFENGEIAPITFSAFQLSDETRYREFNFKPGFQPL